MQAIVHVPFHGETIITIETPEGVYVPVKPLCERLGVSRQGQTTKLKAQPERWGGKNILLPSTGGDQETLCIPLSRVAAWFFTLSINKVKPEVREALEAYQIEAADVLDRHFRLKAQADRTDKVDAEDRAERFRLLTLAANPLFNRIARLQQAGVYLHNLAAVLRRSEEATYALVQEMEEFGLIMRRDWLDEQHRASHQTQMHKVYETMSPVQATLPLDEIISQSAA